MNISRSFGLNKSGVYCIFNVTSRKFYIGSSKNIYFRLRRHYSDLKRGKHENPYLQNSYFKYGHSSFDVYILEEVSVDQLESTEQWYLDNLNPVYNIATLVLRNIPTEESKSKISNTLKLKYQTGILHAPKHIDKQKSVSIYDKKCNYLNTYTSERETGRQLEKLYKELKQGAAIVNAVLNLHNRRKTKRYRDHFILWSHEICDCSKQFRSDSTKVTITNINTDQQFVYPSIIEAAKQLSCSENAIHISLKKERVLLKMYRVTRNEE